MMTHDEWPQWKSRELAVETPIPVVDMRVVDANIARLQHACDAAGVENWPHIKTHKSVAMARRQVEAGAAGLTCQKLGEAETMADAGFEDLLISYNILGEAKLARLAALARRVRLTVSCDSAIVAEGLSRAMGESGAPLAVLIECDTGRGRCGVADSAQAVALARRIDALPGLAFAGVLVYPPNGPVNETRTLVDDIREGCRAHGIDVSTVSSGGTPNFDRIGKAGETQYRSGTSIYNDRQMIAAGVAMPQDCALMVHATVISTAVKGRVIVDAGSKVLTSDLGGLSGYGLLVDYPRACLFQLAEEHGFVDISECPRAPVLGEIVRILPNHVCPVTNLFDRIVTTHDGRTAEWLTIDARGKVS